MNEASRRSAVGRALLARIAALDPRALPHDLALTLRLVRFRAHTWAREADWYWLAVDPSGVGAFGAFLPTAYCGGRLLNCVHNQLASFRFESSADADQYLSLVNDYERLVGQFAERTEGQATRGIYMPRVQVQQACALLAGFKTGVRTAIGVLASRLKAAPSKAFVSAIDSSIANRIEPAFDRAISGLSHSYLAEAPDEVGMEQYPGGASLYAELVKLYTTLDLSPDEVHAKGIERIAEIEASMNSIRAELGFAGDARGFLEWSAGLPKWRAHSTEGVAAVFQQYIDRITPHLGEFFSSLPRAPYAAAPLPEVLQGSMTFGYYDPPRGARGEGRYLFNAKNLTRQPLFHVGALTYHELMPGHHLQLATQQENDALHPFRAHTVVTAYVEGWAEYAAAFAGEIGMYDLPEERYGRLSMDAFLTTRLVVDTGMNALGWSLERARDYMRAHSGLGEAEIVTESIRYSCDYIGQALAYKLGDTQMLALRQRMRNALGARFDLKGFHAAMLGSGALPLGDLEWHVEHEIKRLGEQGQVTHREMRGE